MLVVCQSPCSSKTNRRSLTPHRNDPRPHRRLLGLRALWFGQEEHRRRHHPRAPHREADRAHEARRLGRRDRLEPFLITAHWIPGDKTAVFVDHALLFERQPPHHPAQDKPRDPYPTGHISPYPPAAWPGIAPCPGRRPRHHLRLARRLVLRRVRGRARSTGGPHIHHDLLLLPFVEHHPPLVCRAAGDLGRDHMLPGIHRER